MTFKVKNILKILPKHSVFRLIIYLISKGKSIYTNDLILKKRGYNFFETNFESLPEIKNLVSIIEKEMGNKDSELLKSKKAKIVYRRLINASNVKVYDKNFFQIINPDELSWWPKNLSKDSFELLFKEKISNNLEFEIDDIRIYCSKPEKKGDRQPLHIDTYENNEYKIFVYLTDCLQIKKGPFMYYPKSHNNMLFRKIISIIISFFKKDHHTQMQYTFKEKDCAAVMGKIGTTFIFSTWGVHGGSTAPRDNSSRWSAVCTFKKV